MSDYIINGLMAHFFTEHDNKTSICSRDIDIDNYLSAKRDLTNIRLAPILIELEQQKCDVAHSEFVRKLNISLHLYDGKMIGVTYDKARHHLKLKNDSFSKQYISDALNAAISLVTMSFVDTLTIIPISEKDLPENRKVPYSTFVRWLAKEYEIPVESLSTESLSSSSFGAIKDHECLELLDRLLGDEKLLYPLLFFREGLKDSTEIIFDEREIIESRGSKPLTLSESVKMENCIHNFYKAIEASYGGNLPQDETKIIDKFKVKGVDTEELVGFEREDLVKEKVVKKIIKLRNTRNFKSAHGRIAGDRKSSYYEVLDFQYLCRHVLYSVIKERLEINLYDLEMPRLSFCMNKNN